MKSKVGYSVLENSYESGRETATKASEGLSSKLGLFFTSCVLNQEELVKGAKEVMGDTPIVGCTSSGGIIVPEGMIDSETGFSGMMTFDDENLVVGVACSEATGNAREAGRNIAIEALKNAGVMKVPDYFYMVASPKEEEEYLMGIQDIIGRVPFFGGSAADNTVEGNWSIICNDKIFSDGCAVVFFFTEKEAVTEYTGAYRETDNVGIVTKVENDRTLVTIDGISSLQKYSEWSNIPVENLHGNDLLVASITKPLGVKDPLGNLTVVRHPMVGNDNGTSDPVDDTISLGNKVVEKTAIMQLESTVDELIDSTGNTLKVVNEKMADEACGYFLVHCGGRKLGIGDRMNEVHTQLVRESNGKPFICIFTFGEYGYHENSANICGGLMLSFTGFGE